MPTLPYIIYGTFTDRNGSAVASATITVKNLRTGEISTTTTNSSGQYAFDCGNFIQGYNDYDGIRILGAGSSSIDMEIYVSVDDGNTWQRVENNVETAVQENMTRQKIDTTDYPGGVTLNIVKIA